MTTIRIYYVSALLDVVLTLLGIGLGLQEGNPIIVLGLGWAIAVKVALTVVAIAIIYHLISKGGRTAVLAIRAFIAVVVYQTILVASNARWIVVVLSWNILGN